jgi:hypothetical protein
MFTQKRGKKKKKERRRLMQMEGDYVEEVMKLMEYVASNEDPLIQIVRRHNLYATSDS